MTKFIKGFFCAGLLALVIAVCGCGLMERRIVPNEGVWYCEELEATMEFSNGKRVGTIRVDGVLYECVIENERFTNNIDFLEPSCKALFSGECIRADEEELIVTSAQEPGRKYTFVRVR